MALAISLAIGGGAALAAASSTALSPSATSTMAPPSPTPSSVAHVSGMRHGQDSSDSGGLAQQILCATACMGLTAAPGVPAPGHTLVHQSLPTPPDITVTDAGDQVLLRPTSPPPRALDTI